MTVERPDPPRSWTFEHGLTRLFCRHGRNGGLYLYDAGQDSAWLAMQEPLDVRKWA